MSCFHVSAQLRVCSIPESRLCALFHVGAWCSDPGTHVLSFSFVPWFGHSRSMFYLVVWACSLEFARPWTKLAPDQVRFTEKVTTVTVSEYKLPLFQKCAWLTLLSRVWETSHFEMENPEFPSFQGLHIHLTSFLKQAPVLHMAGDLVFAGHVFVFCACTWLLS